MQIVGKVRLALAPMCNHWWQVPFYLTARGLTTSPMPYGSLICQINFDFIEHQLCIETSAGARQTIVLRPHSIADFYQELMAQLRALGIDVTIWTTPVEVEERTPFEQDYHHAAYDPEYVQRFWRILRQVDRVLNGSELHWNTKIKPH